MIPLCIFDFEMERVLCNFRNKLEKSDEGVLNMYLKKNSEKFYFY